MKIKMIILIGFIMCGYSGIAFSEELTVEQIIEKANIAAYYNGADGVSDVSMSITDSQGRQRMREFKILRLTLEEGGEQKFYVYFKKPADVSKMVLLK